MLAPEPSLTVGLMPRSGTFALPFPTFPFNLFSVENPINSKTNVARRGQRAHGSAGSNAAHATAQHATARAGVSGPEGSATGAAARRVRAHQGVGSARAFSLAS